jgi:hypothetical protein
MTLVSDLRGGRPSNSALSKSLTGLLTISKESKSTGAVLGGEGTSIFGSVNVLPVTPCRDLARCMYVVCCKEKLLPFLVGDCRLCG